MIIYIYVDYIFQLIPFDSLWSKYCHGVPSCEFFAEVSKYSCPNTDPKLAHFQPTFDLKICQGTATAVTQVVKACKDEDNSKAKVNIVIVNVLDDE